VIPTPFIDNLLNRIDIVEVVGRHVALKKSGINFSGLCPFHKEKSPSFTVTPSKQFYHCFGCGVSGDAIKFLTEFAHLSFVEAVRDLAQSVGMAVPEEDLSPAEREHAAAQKKRRATLTDVLSQAAHAYTKHLRDNARATQYVTNRGLSAEIVAQFGLGYAPEGWRNLASVFPQYDNPLLAESGMVILKTEDDAGHALPEAEHKRYDRFRDRIMFPIRSVQGDVIGFGGRVLDKGEPKYLNSPETPVFSKGRELYGLFEGRTAIREHGHALVVEGYMDVVALAQAGLGQAVATLGTACTAEHIHKLFRFTDSVVFSFDGDAAGQRAAKRALEASLPHASDTRTVQFLFLPPEHDPDSYVRQHGKAAFEDCIAQATPLSRQLINVVSEDCDLTTAEGRARMLSTARPLWMLLPEGALKRQLLTDLATAGRDDADELFDQWSHSRPPRQAARVTPLFTPPRRTGRVSKGASKLIDRAVWLLIQRSELWNDLDDDARSLLAAQEPPYDRFLSCIERCIEADGHTHQADLLNKLRAEADDADAGHAVIARIANLHDSEPDTNFKQQLNLVIDRLRLQATEDELEQLFASGLSSPDVLQRSKQLMTQREALKAQLARTPDSV
jgi:DNA primase